MADTHFESLAKEEDKLTHTWTKDSHYVLYVLIARPTMSLLVCPICDHNDNFYHHILNSAKNDQFSSESMLDV